MTKFINKITPVLKLVIEDSLFFLVKFYFKLVLYYTSIVGYCEVDLCNVRCELYQVSTEV